MFRFQSYSKHNSKHYDIFPICVTYTCHLALLRKLKKQFHRLLLHIFNMKWAVGFRIVFNTEAATQRCSLKKLFWKYAANLQENNHQKCDFNKVVLKLCWNHTSAWLSPVNLFHIFRTVFSKNTSGWLLLTVVISNSSNIWYRIRLIVPVRNNFLVSFC